MIRKCSVAAMLAATAFGGTAVGQAIINDQPTLVKPVVPHVTVTDIATAGDVSSTGLILPGVPDGIGAYDMGETVRFYVNHEFGETAGYDWSLDNGATIAGSRITAIDVSKSTRQVVDFSQAIRRIVFADGTELDASNAAGFGLGRLCSGGMAEGLIDEMYLTGEEVTNGRAYALEPATGTFFEIAAFGRGGWENFAVLPTAGTAAEGKTVVLLMDDSSGRAAYLYIGDQDASSSDFLTRNGLTGGRIYGWVSDLGYRSNVDFAGTGNTTTGTWVDITDGYDGSTEDSLVQASYDAGCFLFSRPEDCAYNPMDPASGEFVFASTGRQGVYGGVTIDDPWGQIYTISVDLASIGTKVVTGGLTVSYDGNETGDFGIRSGDNLDWADNGLVYVQEDRSYGDFCQVSGMETSIWQLDPATGEATRIAQVDRTVVPTGTTDGSPADCGNWETSGILDVSSMFGREPGSFFVLDVQAHSVNGGVIAAENLVEGGQINFLEIEAEACFPTAAIADEASMVKPVEDGVSFDVIATAGDSDAGFILPGVPDGIGAYDMGETVRFYVNHEFGETAGYDWSLDNGATIAGSRITAIDVSKSTRQVVDFSQAIRRIVFADGTELDASNAAGFGLGRLCSGGMAEGLIDEMYLTGEEVTNGRAYALEPATGTFFEIAAFGRGGWENFAVLPTAGTAAEGKTVVLLMDDSSGRAAYLYIGDQDASSSDFLTRNGLTGGRIYGWVSDLGYRSNVDFAGTGNTTTGTWVDITDGYDGSTEDSLVQASYDAGCFLFSRPEDCAYNPMDPASGEFVFASTGRQGVYGGVTIDDPWGQIYTISVDLASIGTKVVTGGLTVSYDGNETGDFGIRSGDNLDWADNGLVYVQEDRSYGDFCQVSGMETSIWQLDPATGEATRIAQVDRTVVPTGTTDGSPADCGNWETSGILDVSSMFGREPGSFFVLDVQAHSVNGGVIAAENLVEGGQLLFMSIEPIGCNADLTGDGRVDAADLGIVLGNWGTAAGDVNNDGTTDGADLSLILALWGGC